MLVAILHVLGAFIVTFAIGLFVLWLGSWEVERTQKRRLQDASVAIGVPVSALALEGSDVDPRFLSYVSQRFSGELLRNRIADLCGIVRTGWGWFGAFLQLVVVAMVFWDMYESGSGSAVLMWSVVAITLVFWFSSVFFSLVCLLLTGRYPGEPKAARKAIAAFIEQRGALADRASMAGDR
jgi:hypothetical protein